MNQVIDIHYRMDYPCNVLSNLNDNAFTFREIRFKSMEALLLGLVASDVNTQNQIFAMEGLQAKRFIKNVRSTKNVLYWQGKAFNRHSDYYQELLLEAYLSMALQNSEFRSALYISKGYELDHSIGKDDPETTILTRKEFLDILNYIRGLL